MRIDQLHKAPYGTNAAVEADAAVLIYERLKTAKIIAKVTMEDQTSGTVLMVLSALCAELSSGQGSRTNK